MTNPLLDKSKTATPGSGPMQPGDVRHIEVKDRHGSIVKTLTIHRTDRPYSHDLWDAYNAGLTRDDIEWAVDGNDQLYLRDKPARSAQRTRDIATKAENERERWKRAHERGDGQW